MTLWFILTTHSTLRVLKAFKCIWVGLLLLLIAFFNVINSLTRFTSIGTFSTGEARLLFSSKQVDYIRYWLHAMQITKDMVPLPYSDCLLTEANLRTVSPVVYPDGFSLKNALKVFILFRVNMTYSLILESSRPSKRTINVLKAPIPFLRTVDTFSSGYAPSGQRRRERGVHSTSRLGSGIILSSPSLVGAAFLGTGMGMERKVAVQLGKKRKVI